MNIWFWTIIAFMTLVAWSCIVLPLFNKATFKAGHWVKAWILGFPILAIGLYLGFGDSRQLQQFWNWQRQNVQVQQQIAELKNPQQLIDRLLNHLQQDPQSADGWYLLGKLYLDQRQYADAEFALNKARQLQPHSGETIVALAKANFFNHQGQLTQPMAEMLSSVLESLAEPVDALNLLAVNAYRGKNFHQAVSYWQRALLLVPPDSPDSRTLLDMISQAQHEEKGELNGRNN